MRYDKTSKQWSRLSFLLSLAETVSVFSRVSKVKYLQFKSIRKRIRTSMHTHNKVNDKILVISNFRRITSCSDLIKVEDGNGDTLRHLYTYKKKKKRNTNFAFMHKVVKAYKVVQVKAR